MKATCVVGVEDDEAGEVPLACVILKEGQTATEQEITRLVKGKFCLVTFTPSCSKCIRCTPSGVSDTRCSITCLHRRKKSMRVALNLNSFTLHTKFTENLADYKHLRGGVKFMEKFPLTDLGKIKRKELRDQIRAEI